MRSCFIGKALGATRARAAAAHIMPRGRASARVLHRAIALCLLACLIFIPCRSHALCAAQHIEGKWINEDPQSGNFHSIEIEVPCYDTAGASGPVAKIHVYGVCHPAPCDWGEIPASSAFTSEETGQLTRVSARYDWGSLLVDITILQLAADRLIVFSEYDFRDAPTSGNRVDRSRIEYFRPQNRWVEVSAYPANPKQGDVIAFSLNVGDQVSLDRIHYTLNNATGLMQTPPYTIEMNTCKTTGRYHTELTLQGEAMYRDGERVPFAYNHDLTSGRHIRENQTRTYAFYVAEDSDKDFEGRSIERANAFIDEFNSYSRAQYHYAEPWFYTTNAIDFANGVDLAISIGHGRPHVFVTGNGDVDLSATEFGSLSPCHRTGDLEYLVFVACSTLNDATIGNIPFQDHWFHRDASKLQARPFTGLHMVLGFLNHVHFRHWFLDDNGNDFLKAFAEKLDDGMEVRTAWLEAADDELPIDSSQNRAGVLYLEEYEHDRLSTVRDDFIYGNPKYGRSWLESY
jgi:hypothetical protein